MPSEKASGSTSVVMIFEICKRCAAAMSEALHKTEDLNGVYDSTLWSY